ncbi:hypothetical protein R2R35_22865 [Anaerocolumna sp. AGMB13020]|uniref:hypothetical protein n=1 Tax=Anaerocolumna sp. AGMB13020 TaxID=3081750 RepID=UPI0029554CCD|nr:hypothetical protein [Anaerocolumna sp. AGMB13020]WOO36600.1 hypothetical protein R2R35_22865 [Anaerocolumna sp. AGMB13020]
MSGVVSLATLGYGATIAKGGGDLAKMFAADILAEVVSGSTVIVCDKAGVPSTVTVALAILLGSTTGMIADKALLKNTPLLKNGIEIDDTAFFWSGRTEGVGGSEVAANIAKEKGGVTLESTIEAKNISMPEWDFSNPSTTEAWDLASGAYAEQVSGEIRAVIGSQLREGNIWENVELPRLINNPNITKITTIDPKTGIETIIFER